MAARASFLLAVVKASSCFHRQKTEEGTDDKYLVFCRSGCYFIGLSRRHKCLSVCSSSRACHSLCRGLVNVCFGVWESIYCCEDGGREQGQGGWQAVSEHMVIFQSSVCHIICGASLKLTLVS